MSIYKTALQDLNVDFFQLPITAGGYSLLLDFSWDTVAQRHYDNIQRSLTALATANPLVLISALSDIIPNEDFIGYINGWNSLLSTCNLCASKWIASLINDPENVSWEDFQTEVNSFIESFSNQYISFNHFSKLQEFLAHLQQILSSASSHLVSESLYLLQNMPEALYDYIGQYTSYVNEVSVQKSDLEELLYWSITVHYGEESYTSALEVGCLHFDQASFPHIFFESQREKIGRNDLGAVTLWVGIDDGSV